MGLLDTLTKDKKPSLAGTLSVAPGKTSSVAAARPAPKAPEPKPNIVEFYAGLGRGLLRGFASTGAAVTGLPEQVRALATNTPVKEGTGTFTPTGLFQKSLYGTDKPVSFASVGAEFGLDEKGLTAPLVGALAGVLDLTGAGGAKKPVISFSTKTLGKINAFLKSKTVAKADIQALIKAPETTPGEAELLSTLVRAEGDTIDVPAFSQKLRSAVRTGEQTPPPSQISPPGRAPGQPPASTPPKLTTKPSSLPDETTEGRKLSTFRKLFTSGRRILQESGPAGKTMAKTIESQRTDEDLLTGKYVAGVKNVLSGLSKEQRLQVTDVLEGKMVDAPEPVLKAATEMRAWLDEVADRATAEGFEIRVGGTKVPFAKRPDYFPRQYDFDALEKGAQRDRALEHLVQTGQARNLAEAEKLLDDYIMANAERRAGNLENARMLDLPGYERDPLEALPRYASSVARRFTEAQHFGKKDEIVAGLIDQISKQGGDYKEAQRIFDFTVDGLPKNKVVSAITQFNVATKLSLSAITNSTQSINTATKAGILNTVRAMWKGFSREGRQLAELVNAYDDFIYVRESGINPHRLVRGVMFVFKKVENFNRRTAANAGVLRAQQLADRLRGGREGLVSKHAVRQLESLGIDIERALDGTMTDDDLLRAASKMIERTQFKVDPLDIPPSWKTPLGRLITQFKSFSFMQTKFVRDEILAEAKKGNFLPLTTFVLLAVPASLLVARVRNFLTGRKEDEQSSIDIRDWDKYMKAFGTIPTDLLIQGKFLNDTFRGDYSNLKTPIEKAARAFGTLFGPTADEAGKLVGSLEQIPRTQEKNKYLRKSGREQDTLLALKRQAVEKIPFVGQYLKNKYFAYPTSAKTQEQKDTNAVLYDLVDELAQLPYGDPQAKQRLLEYAEGLPSDDERQRQLFVFRQNGIDTSGVSSSGDVLRIRPTFERVVQLIKDGDEAGAAAIVEGLSEGDFEAFKKARTSWRAKNTETVRELIGSDPRAAVEFIRTLPEKENARIADLLTDEEYQAIISAREVVN